jgi:hypothetical protein
MLSNGFLDRAESNKSEIVGFRLLLILFGRSQSETNLNVQPVQNATTFESFHIGV